MIFFQVCLNNPSSWTTLQISQTLNAATPGTKFLLREGTYNVANMITINAVGTDVDPITIEVYPGETAQFYHTGSCHNFFRLEGQYWHIKSGYGTLEFFSDVECDNDVLLINSNGFVQIRGPRTKIYGQHMYGVNLFEGDGHLVEGVQFDLTHSGSSRCIEYYEDDPGNPELPHIYGDYKRLSILRNRFENCNYGVSLYGNIHHTTVDGNYFLNWGENAVYFNVGTGNNPKGIGYVKIQNNVFQQENPGSSSLVRTDHVFNDALNIFSVFFQNNLAFFDESITGAFVYFTGTADTDINTFRIINNVVRRQMSSTVPDFIKHENDDDFNTAAQLSFRNNFIEIPTKPEVNQWDYEDNYHQYFANDRFRTSGDENHPNLGAQMIKRPFVGSVYPVSPVRDFFFTVHDYPSDVRFISRNLNHFYAGPFDNTTYTYPQQCPGTGATNLGCTRCYDSLYYDIFYPTVFECSQCIHPRFNLANNCQSCLDTNFDVTKYCVVCVQENYDEFTDCLTCKDHYNLTTSCVECEKNYDISSSCVDCIFGYDVNENCELCIPNYDDTNNCESCFIGFDMSTSCADCLPNYDVSVPNVCDSCLDNYDISTLCEDCIDGFDISSSCVYCLSNYNDSIPNVCDKCVGNYDISALCQDCLPGFSISSLCDECSENYDNETNCQACIGNFDVSKNCQGCLDGFNISTNCEECLQNYDLSNNCQICVSGFDILKNCSECLPNYNTSVDGVCDQCIANYDIQNLCQTCNIGYDFTTDCSSCLPNYADNECTTCSSNYDIDYLCVSCLNNYDIDSGCTTCLSNYDVNSLCVDCLNSFDIDSGCTSCLPNFDIDSLCETCMQGYELDGDACALITDSDGSLIGYIAGGVGGGVVVLVVLLIIIIVAICCCCCCARKKKGSGMVIELEDKSNSSSSSSDDEKKDDSD